MQIIDGKAVSASVKAQVKAECEELKKKGITPIQREEYVIKNIKGKYSKVE